MSEKKKSVYVPPFALPHILTAVRVMERMRPPHIPHPLYEYDVNAYRLDFINELVDLGFAGSRDTAATWVNAVINGNYTTTTSAPHWATPSPPHLESEEAFIQYAKKQIERIIRGTYERLGPPKHVPHGENLASEIFQLLMMLQRAQSDASVEADPRSRWGDDMINLWRRLYYSSVGLQALADAKGSTE